MSWYGIDTFPLSYIQELDLIVFTSIDYMAAGTQVYYTSFIFVFLKYFISMVNS